MQTMKKGWETMALLLLLCPAWALAQTVYFNPDGGRYFHADPHCASISEAYWAGMRETTEEEALQRGLSGSCPRCMPREAESGSSSGPTEAEPTASGLTGSGWSDGAGASALRFGGSGTDEVQDLAVTPDGRVVMAGMTRSSDGTLLDRIRSGQSGFVALVDLRGNTCWNFCSRYGSDDRMKAPVAHADGTITVLLESKDSAYDQVELIRLDASGNVLNRKPLVHLSQEESGCAPEEPGVFSGGYVVATYDTSKRIDFEPVYRYSVEAVYQPVYHFFDFDGNLLCQTRALWPNGIALISRAHAIEAIDQVYWLCALDEQGNRRKLTRLYEGLRSTEAYLDLVTLDDGGAMACLYRQVKGEESSVIKRWDAQGNLVFEIPLAGFCAQRLQALGDRIAVCGEGQGIRELLVLDHAGQVLSRQTVENFSAEGRSLLALDERHVLLAEDVNGGVSPAGEYAWDAQLRVIPVGS